MDYLSPRIKARWNALSASMTLALVFIYVFLLFTYYNTGNQFQIQTYSPPTFETEVGADTGQNYFHQKQKAQVYQSYHLDLNVVFFPGAVIKTNELKARNYCQSTKSFYLKYLLCKRSRDPPEEPVSFLL